MDVLGIGVDIQDVKRFAEMRRSISERNFLRIFTGAEVEHCMGKADPDEHFCGRFAAKEAVVKCLGVPRSKGFILSEIEILGSNGTPPFCNLHGSIAELLKEKGGGNVILSISHTKDTAISIAIWSR